MPSRPCTTAATRWSSWDHELNAVCYHTPGRKTGWLRHHGDKNRTMHQGTLDDFPGHEDPASEWRTLWMPWFKRLPLFIDLGGLRAVHACWHPRHIALLAGRTVEVDDFLHAAADKTTPEGEAIEALLKGIEVPLGRFAGRTSCHAWWPNQLRLPLSTLAHVLVEGLRRLELRGTEWAERQATTFSSPALSSRRSLAYPPPCSKLAGFAGRLILRF